MKTKILKINNLDLKVEVADREGTRRKGLSGREDLEKDSGMLFVFTNEQNLSFWMKNTAIPLSIAFLDKKGAVIEIKNLNPGEEESVKSSKKAKFALEMNSGWFKDNNIEAGHCFAGVDEPKQAKINIKIVNLPPEAEKLAKKIENTMADMITRTVKTMVQPGKDIENFSILVKEDFRSKSNKEANLDLITAKETI
jgi:uncharacterized membrane protein (UPF0127 family)